jgi:Flp pilus assembly pilin Flp
MKRFYQLLVDDEAAASVEYGILIAGIALVIALSIVTLGQAVSNIYSEASTLFQ